MRFYIIACFVFLFLSTCTKPTRFDIGFKEPENPEPVNEKNWDLISGDLQTSFASIDTSYARDMPPALSNKNSWTGTGWKGEKIHTKILLWSSQDHASVNWQFSEFINADGKILPPESFNIRIVRYLLTDEFLNGCGARNPDTIKARLVGDILEPVSTFNLHGKSTRPLWISVQIPRNADPGNYKGQLSIHYQSDSSQVFEMNICVQDRLLPPPADWSFHLDLWQNPFAVARFHNIPLWSQEHWDLLKPVLKMLADAGQKCITTSIVYKPWGGQCYDTYESMIEWIYNSSGKWEYDYSIFDQYVELAMECGIKKQISCYSMVPWGNTLRYFDQDSSKYISKQIRPGSEEYEYYWQSFLFDFRAHLQEKGWLNKVSIAMDERRLEDMQKLISFIQETAPEFKISLAGGYYPEISDDLDNLCIFIHPETDKKLIAQRKDKGQITTFYTCCTRPEHPNNFTFSPPAENAWMGWHAAAQGYSGFLRWAYNSWVKDPLMDSRFKTWPAGDTYMIYPGPRSSIRFERLREGIQDYEKIRIIKEELEACGIDEDMETLKELENFLKNINLSNLEVKPASYWVISGKKLINRISNSK